MKNFVVLLAICLSINSLSQSFSRARYYVNYPMFSYLVERYPEKRVKINKSSEKLPLYIDVYKIGNDIVTVGVLRDSSIRYVSIYQFSSLQRISINKTKTVEYMDFNIVQNDTLTFDIKQVTEDSTYFLNCVGKDIFPIKLFVNDSVLGKQQELFVTNWYLNFPEISFMQKYKVFPEKIAFGIPKHMKVYSKLDENQLDSPKWIEAYKAFVKDEKSKKKRKQLFELISDSDSFYKK